MSRMDAEGPRLPTDADTLLPLRPKLGPDFERPTQTPLPRPLRREKRNATQRRLRLIAVL